MYEFLKYKAKLLFYIIIILFIITIIGILCFLVFDIRGFLFGAIGTFILIPILFVIYTIFELIWSSFRGFKEIPKDEINFKQRLSNWVSFFNI